MHPASYNEMNANLSRYASALKEGDATVLDVGSFNVNGSYRDLMAPQWKYVGVDMRAGPNVDLVMPSEFDIPLGDDSVDLVISGQCLEHCRNPFRLVAEAARILRPGGLMILAAPFVFFEHKEPIDCFRFLPDGMTALFAQAGMETLRTYLLPAEADHVDCWGIGRKPTCA